MLSLKEVLNLYILVFICVRFLIYLCMNNFLIDHKMKLVACRHTNGVFQRNKLSNKPAHTCPGGKLRNYLPSIYFNYLNNFENWALIQTV